MTLSASTVLAYTTASNTQIINTATLNFTGGTATASVVVTVGLIPSAPALAITNGTSAYTAANTPAIIDSLSITSSANGPAQYTVSALASAVANSNLALNSAITVALPNPITIGATITNASTTWGTLKVPSDGTADSIVNNIQLNSWITFNVGTGNITRQVLSVTDPGTTGTATITFVTAGGDPATVPAGTPIYEKVFVNLTVVPGTVATPGTPIDVTVTATVATPGVAVSPTITNGAPNHWTTPPAGVTIDKYVRNATTDASTFFIAPGVAPSPYSTTINGATHNYYRSTSTSGVSAKPGEVLEYLVEATNTSGPPSAVPAMDIAGCFITDALQTTYVTLTLGQMSGGKDLWYIPPAGGVGANYNIADLGSFVSPTLSVNVGNGAGAGAATGTIPAGKKVSILYRVTVL